MFACCCCVCPQVMGGDRHSGRHSKSAPGTKLHNSLASSLNADLDELALLQQPTMVLPQSQAWFFDNRYTSMPNAAHIDRHAWRLFCWSFCLVSLGHVLGRLICQYGTASYECVVCRFKVLAFVLTVNVVMSGIVFGFAALKATHRC